MRPKLLVPLALVLALTAAPSPAQGVDFHQFYPLGIGDTWVYEVAYGAPYEGQIESYQPIELVGYQRRTVLRDTVLGGEPYRLVRIDSLSSEPGYAVLAEALCGVRVTETAHVEWVAVDDSGGGTCWAPEAEYGLDLNAGSPSEDNLYINARPHEFESVKKWEEPGDVAFEAAADLGLVQWSLGPMSSVHEERRIMRVVHAIVGEEEYGYPLGSDAWRAFYPLYEGDIREYEMHGQVCGSPELCTLYYRWDVGADTTIDGTTYRAVRQRTFSEDFELLYDDRCAIRVGEGIVEAVYSQCAYPATFLDSTWMDLRSYTWTVSPTSFGGERPSKTFSFDTPAETVVREVAEDVGVIRGADWESGPSSYTTEYWLRYAVVDGVTYGTPVLPTVANEAGAAPVAFALGAASPNPFRSTVTLTLSLPLAEAVTLEAFDVLGRRVLLRDLGPQPAGATPHRLDLSGLPPGSYFVRAIAPSSGTRVQRVTKVE